MMKRLLAALFLVASIASGQTTDVSSLPAASSVNGADEWICDQNVATEPHKCTTDQLSTFLGAHFSPDADPAVDHGSYVAGHANGGNCAAGEIPLGVDAAGAVESCYEPAEADISDLDHTATSVTDGLIVEADLNEDSGTPVDEDVLTFDVTGANFAWIAQGTLAAGTAAALAANGGNCAAGEIPLGVDAAGAVESCYEPSEADISDLSHVATGITDGLIVEADLNEDSGTPTDEDVLTFDSTGANFNWLAQGSIAAGTAAALAANGGNCAAGSYPLGVDAAGAIESCTDATTEIDAVVATHTAVIDAHIDHADTLAELNTQISSAVVTGPHDGVGYDEIMEEAAGLTKRAQLNFIGANVTCVDNAGATRTDCTVAAGAGAPADADYLVGTANGSLSAEIVVGTSPQGELGGTWGSPTIDDGLSVANWLFTTSVNIPNGAAPTVDAAGEIAEDTSSPQLIFGANANVLDPEICTTMGLADLAAADDNFEFWMHGTGVTVTKIGLHCRGTCTTGADISLEDRSGNAMTHTVPTHSTGTSNTTYQAVTANNVLVAGEGLRFDVDNAVSPETDEYTIGWCYTVTRE